MDLKCDEIQTLAPKEMTEKKTLTKFDSHSIRTPFMNRTRQL